MQLTPTLLLQISVHFLLRNGSRPMPADRLSRLLYLAHRDSLDRYDDPISHDRAVAAESGPALELAVRLMEGTAGKADCARWDAWLCRGESGSIGLRVPMAQADCDHLSEADIGILDAVWAEFSPMSDAELARHCAGLEEWRSAPTGQRIREEQTLQALGRSAREAGLIAREIREHRYMDRALSAC